MVADPRCPACDGKVSATATWCMHCGADFDRPVEADSGRPVDDRRQADRTGMSGDGFFDGYDAGPSLAGVGIAILGLITVPVVAPANVTLAYLAAVVGTGVYAARQSSVTEALRRGLQSLAAVPLVLWLLALLFVGGVAAGTPLGPVAYALVLLYISRTID